MWQPAAIPHTVFDRPCLDFVNSKFSEVSEGREEYDRLDVTEWRRWFLERWDLPATAQVSQTTLRRLKALRKDLRRSLEQRRTSEAALQRFNAVLAATPQVWRLELVAHAARRQEPAVQLVPLRPGWDAVMTRIVLSYAELASSGDIQRVKRCANPNCSFLLFDDSVNQARRWCDPASCGNLIRVRRFRASQGGQA